MASPKLKKSHPKDLIFESVQYFSIVVGNASKVHKHIGNGKWKN
jgi:hypothetical protein